MSFTLCSSAQTGNDTKVKLVEPPFADSSQTFVMVEQLPQYAGGDNGLLRFIAQNTMYPDSARAHDASGTVYISFTVEKDASTSGHKIIRSTKNEWLDQECLRVSRLVHFETPGYQQGKAVRVQFTLPIKFTLK